MEKKKDVETLQKENKSLKKQNNDYDKQIKDIDKRIASYNSSNEKLNRQMAEVSGFWKRLFSKKARNTLTSLVENIDFNNEEIKKLKTEKTGYENGKNYNTILIDKNNLEIIHLQEQTKEVLPEKVNANEELAPDKNSKN